MRFNRRQKDLPARRDDRKRMAGRNRWTRRLEALERRELLAIDSSMPWHNADNPRDVNHDNHVTPLDALVVFNHLLKYGVHSVPTGEVTPLAAAKSISQTNYVDVTGDNVVTPLDALRVVNALAVDDQAQISVITTDLSGTPITQVSVGSQFQLRAIVQDVRNPPDQFQGVFAAYLNVGYDSSLATVATSGAISYDAFFNLARTGSTSTPGLISGAGAATTSASPPGSAPQALWTVTATAAAPGVVTFTPSFDSNLGHDVLLYGGSAEPVPSDAIDFVGASLTITSESTEPTLSVNNVSLNEGNSGTTQFVYNVVLSEASSQVVTVQFATANPASGSIATPGSDYAATSGTLTFSPGATLQLITVLVNGDQSVESDEVFNLVLSNPTNSVLGSASTGLGTILNDDALSNLTIGDVTVQNVMAGTTNAVFTVTLSPASTGTVTVQYATADGTGAAGADYTSTSGTLTFSAGALTRLITVPIIGDSQPDTTETFFVNLTSPSANAVITDNQALGTILPAVSQPGVLTISDVSVVEGNSGNVNAVFSVSLSQPLGNQVTVQYSTADGTATVANSDYVAANGILTFAPGTTAQTVTVAVTGDTTTEPNETFSVNLSNAVGATIFDGLGTGTIINDDGQKALVELRLADENGVEFTGAETLNVNDIFQLHVYVQDTQDDPQGIAAAYLDVLYNSGLVAVTGPIEFSAEFADVQSGSTATPGLIDEVGAFQVSPPSDPGAAQLLFSINLQALDVGIATFTAEPADLGGHDVLEFGSDEPVPSASIIFVNDSVNVGSNVFLIDSVSHSEGNAGTTNFVFTVSRFLSNGQTATVEYSTSNGTATAGSDYTAASGTLTFTPGVTSKTITVSVNGDTTDENDETFFVALSNPIGAIAAQSPGAGTILNDDSPPGMSIANATGDEGTNLAFTVNLSQASGKTVTVAYSTADALSGTPATAGADYTPVSGTLTFNPGVTQQTISVPLLGDQVVDNNEVFRVELSNPSNATLTLATATGTIVDVPPATISGLVYVDSNNNGLKEGSEVGIQGATVQALRDGVIVATAVSAADGTYMLVGLQPGTYTIRELQPGYYLDGRDTHLGIDSSTNDTFTGVVLAPRGATGGYNFGEGTLRTEFVSAFLNRRAFLSSSINNPPNGALYSLDNIDLTRGDAWVSIDGGWQGPRTIKALFDAAQGSATLYLYNNAMQLVAVSSATPTGSQITYSGVPGPAYFLKISGTNQHVDLEFVDTLSIGNVTQFEGHSGTTNMVFTAMLSATQSQAVTVAYNTVDGSATAASGDYVATSGTLTFAPGEVSKLITVVVNGDTANESDETFSLQFSSANNIQVGVSAGVGTILNDDSTSLGPFLFSSTTPNVTTSATPSTTSGGDEDDAEVAASVTTVAEPMIAAPALATSSSTDEQTSVTDAALEDDEDWVTELMLA